MSVRQIKTKVLELLDTGNLPESLRQLDELPVKDVVNALFSAICRTENTIHWNGVRCMGIFVARLADKDMEEARIIMRRMLWSLNDESGGIGWGVPEAMAEIMCCHDRLAEEYIHMLISYMREDGEELFQDGNYLEHAFLQRGLLWGIGRLAEEKQEMLVERGVIRDVLPYLDSEDAAVRGLAARALGFLPAPEAYPLLKPLVQDKTAFETYIDGKVVSCTVGHLARESLERIEERNQCV